jgi:SAM-dependent methyltransferase
MNMSDLGRLYQNIYGGVCGESPRERPWHFQWLSTFYLYRSLSCLLPIYGGGRVLDVGCGKKPYQTWFGRVSEYVGLDVAPGSKVDVVVESDELWPLTDEHFDTVLSTQAIEHANDLELTLGQMSRVLKTGGTIILSFPFLYNVHGAPHDHRRFTHFGATKLLQGYEILHLETQGGIGSTLVILLQNCIDTALSRATATKVLKGLLLPVSIPLSLVLNLLGLAMDGLDRTNSFYSNILLVARKH